MWIVFFCFSVLSFAETASTDQSKALSQVMELLRSSSKRQEIIKNDPKGKEADALVKDIGGIYSEDIYNLAAEVMQTLAAEAQGDPDKMEKILEKARKDPAGFAQKFTAKQRATLKELAEKIQKTKTNP